MFLRAFVAALVLCTAALPPPASAQRVTTTACGQREAITTKLKQAYREHQWGAGLVNGSRIFEVWRSSETGTWTILMTRPDGTACVMAAGQHWRDAMPVVVSGDPA